VGAFVVGLADGLDDGLAAGWDDGFEDGLVDGLDEGFEEGLVDGSDEGWDDGSDNGAVVGWSPFPIGVDAPPPLRLPWGVAPVARGVAPDPLAALSGFGWPEPCPASGVGDNALATVPGRSVFMFSLDEWVKTKIATSGINTAATRGTTSVADGKLRERDPR
jgi:hypothetical protein